MSKFVYSVSPRVEDEIVDGEQYRDKGVNVGMVGEIANGITSLR